MKVGIMSMQRIKNYGSFLQAYGLKQIIESLGHEVLFVDYKIESPLVTKGLMNNIHIKKLYEPIIQFIRVLIGRAKNDKYNLEVIYEDYLYELGITDKRTENVPVDVLVIGSDEVFNCLQDNYDVGYSKQLFGEGVNAKKVISYAASCGYTTVGGLEKYGIRNEVARMLTNNFTAHSARDDNTGRVITELTKTTPEMNADPVLIADYTDKIIRKKNLSGYIIVYSYMNRISDEEEMAAIRDFAREKGLKTISIGVHQRWTDLKINASPFELLGYFADADYVVTDTFHGTVFSIITKRKFATIVRGETAKSNYSNSNKLSALLQRFGLEDRELRRPSQIGEIIEKDIDFRKIDEIRNEERKKALKYLKNNIAL